MLQRKEGGAVSSTWNVGGWWSDHQGLHGKSDTRFGVQGQVGVQPGRTFKRGLWGSDRLGELLSISSVISQ